MVEQVNGHWLWLVAEGLSVKGWAPAANVILIDRAIDYITRQIDANPGDAAKYVWRANVWLELKEFDIAIADFNEAIRLDPRSAGVAYQGRGRAWCDKKNYDKAIADCNEAIRLDPGYALAYLTRGVVWSDKKDYDKAMADYNEAIRLDPGYARAYNGRGNAWNAKKDYDQAIADYNEAIRLDPGFAHAYNSRGNAWMPRRITTRPLPTTTKPSGSTPGLHTPTTVVAMPGAPRRITTRPLPTTTKPSGSILGMHLPTTVVAMPGAPRRITTRPLPTTTRPSGSTLGMHMPIATAAWHFSLPDRRKVGDDARKVLELEGWRGEYSQYAVLWGYFGLRRAGNADAAKRLLDDAAARCDTTAWPYPVIRYLRGELDQTAELAAASDNDEMTVARFYLGLDLRSKGGTRRPGSTTAGSRNTGTRASSNSLLHWPNWTSWQESDCRAPRDPLSGLLPCPETTRAASPSKCRGPGVEISNHGMMQAR